MACSSCRAFRNLPSYPTVSTATHYQEQSKRLQGPSAMAWVVGASLARGRIVGRRSRLLTSGHDLVVQHACGFPLLQTHPGQIARCSICNSGDWYWFGLLPLVLPKGFLCRNHGWSSVVERSLICPPPTNVTRAEALRLRTTDTLKRPRLQRSIGEERNVQ